MKPTFYRNGRESDTIHELLSADLKPDPLLLRQALNDFMKHGFVLGEKTPFKEITRKHKIVLHKKGSITNISEIKKIFLLELKKSVEDLIQNERKIGLFLSGGIDSTLIAITLGNYFKNVDVHTFTASFQGNLEDVKLAKETSEKYGFYHHIVPININTDFNNWYDIIKAIGMPISDEASIALFRLAEKANKEGIKTILMGDGNDELWCGYDWYYTMRKRKEKVPHISFIGSFLKRTNLPKIKNIGEMLEYKNWRDFIESRYLFDLKESLPHCWLEQRYMIAKHFGLTAKFPFLRQSLIDLAYNVPLELKLKSYNKWMVVQALADVDKLILERKKGMMGFPKKEMLKSNINRIKKIIDDFGFFKYSPLDGYLKTHRKFIFTLYLQYLSSLNV
jgi:asparagine synthetase B (glutamine-hydrolysing)